METINISTEYPTLFINHENDLSQRAEALANAQKKFINIIDVKKHALTPLQIIEISRRCNVPVNELFDRTQSFYQEKVHHTSHYSELDLAQMLSNNPSLFRTPFVVKGDDFRFYEGSHSLA